jgi:hypothetical protein
VGIIAQPALPGPFFLGSAGIDDQLREIRLRYGPSRLPGAYLLTHRPLPGEERDTSLLVTALCNFVVVSAGRPRTHDLAVVVLRAVEAAPREPAEARLCGAPVPGVRVRVAGCEGLEIPYLEIPYRGSR